MKTACFFFTPRTVTLLLALFGITTHLASIVTTILVSNSLPLTYFVKLSLLSYSLLSVYACFSGVTGAIKNSSHLVSIFSWYYCFDTLIQTLFSVGAVFLTSYTDLGVCQDIFETTDGLGTYACDFSISSGIWMVSTIILANALIKVYLANVIRSHVRELAKKSDEELCAQSGQLIIVPSPAALAADDEKVIYVAGHEFVPYNDEKK
ncbi:hypothetical protein CLU79DRAFT_764061 [Phycomyces nitens]|nr:hypothetical protein CLU79DRAFT_764061 [Phycomyces nitens]